ncbi:MAG: hypothetical protein IKC43_01435 [Clostridia bacterium]|nr:hypothetical protein [Clostridia bacterium]
MKNKEKAVEKLKNFSTAFVKGKTFAIGKSFMRKQSLSALLLITRAAGANITPR